MSTVTDLESYQQFALQQQAQNNVWSAEQAQKQMDFQREMSNTAHQREVADLQAAGLNPILSANSGASVPNGASGETDTSAAGNVGAILQQVLQAQSAREVAAMYNAATINAASIAANASMYGSDMQYQIKQDFPSGLDSLAAKLIQQFLPESGSPSNAKTIQQNISYVWNSTKNAFSSLLNSGNSWFRNLSSMQRSYVLKAYQKNPKLFDALFRLGRVDLIGNLLNKFAGKSGKF